MPLQRLSKKQLIDYIKSINASDYTAHRNYLGGSTRISEYITRGAISLPQVRDLILINNSASDAYKLINELSWREYWQLVWRVRGEEIFEYIKPLPFKPRQGIPIAILNANTGIKVLDTFTPSIRRRFAVSNVTDSMAGLIDYIDGKIQYSGTYYSGKERIFPSE